MAALAVFEGQVAAEGSSAVVTGETRRTARGDEVFGGRGRTDLTRLGRAGCQTMTVSAGELFAGAVVCVAECVTIRTRSRRRWFI